MKRGKVGAPTNTILYVPREIMQARARKRRKKLAANAAETARVQSQFYVPNNTDEPQLRKGAHVQAEQARKAVSPTPLAPPAERFTRAKLRELLRGNESERRRRNRAQAPGARPSP